VIPASGGSSLGAAVMHGVTLVAFGLHIGGGSVALLAGSVAAVAPKGGRVHRVAGTIFFAGMLLMGTFAAYLAVVMPGQMVNLLGGVFTVYLVATGWMTVRRPAGAAGLTEKIGLAVILCLCAPFAWITWQVVSGGAPQIQGPLLVATYSFALVLVIAAVCDARVVMAGGIAGAPRIARHLWRMCLGLVMATGSAFTNGFARFLPGPYHVPMVFFLPQVLPLALLIFWMIRVRLTGWAKGRMMLRPA
jgi:hypothetical protein